MPCWSPLSLSNPHEVPRISVARRICTQFDSHDEILADLESKLAKWHLTPRRSDVPRVAVQLVRKNHQTNADRHVYELQMTITNTSSVSIPEIEYELEFPRAFVPPNRQFHAHEERSEQATRTHRAFRGRKKIDLRPNRSALVENMLEYHVTDDLFWKYKDSMKDLPVTVEVFAEGKLIGTATAPFQALQNF
jgi:hypothetical protein